MDENPPGVLINARRASPAYRRAAVLMATIAKPPKSAADIAWNRRILSFCRCYWAHYFARAPGSDAVHGTYIPQELMVPKAQAERDMEYVLHMFSRAMAAAEVIAPYFMRVQAKLHNHPVPHLQHKPEIKKEIEKVLRREAEYRMSLAPPLRKMMRPRMPDVSSAREVSNFTQRNLRPFRPVLHLVLAFHYELEMRAKRLVAEVEREAGDGVKRAASPMLRWWEIADSGGLLDAVFDTAQRLEPFVPNLEIAHSPDDKVVRLRLG